MTKPKLKQSSSAVPNIMIVDDDPDNLSVLHEILSEGGYRVRPAISGKIAIKALNEDLADLVLLDVLMPDLDGFEVCQILKSEEKTRKIPVVFLSALGDKADKIKGFELGGVDYITKPFYAEEVLARIKTHLSLKEAKESAQSAHLMLEAIFRSFPDTIITVDKSLKIINHNSDPNGLFCFQHLNASHENSDFSLHEPLAPCLEVLRKTLKTGQSVTDQRVVCTDRSGTRKTEILNTAPLIDHNDQFSGVVLTIRDISRLARLEEQILNRSTFRNIVGKSERLQKVLSIMERISELDVNVLVTGESGTGKELIAEAIHFSSSRSNAPLVKVNCAALSETLLESELFGHVRGAFTGAVKDREGRFQKAEGGTIFLDEIGDISPAFQRKLLRLLEQKEYERMGESITKKADVRVICATNSDLPSKIDQKGFREDLYYRIRSVNLQLPPLRERPDDIPLLVKRFIRDFSDTHQKNISGISDQVSRIFVKHKWPGNIRELKSAVEYACALSSSEVIEVEDLPQELQSSLSSELSSASDKASANTIERDAILSVLQQVDGNKAKAARLLGISRGTLYNRLIKHDLN